jgi:hypothetical protein
MKKTGSGLTMVKFALSEGGYGDYALRSKNLPRAREHLKHLGGSIQRNDQR